MKCMLMFLALLILAGGCCNHDLTGERLGEINDQWLKMYTADRRMTTAEATEYAALDQAGKDKWRQEGKPTDRPMSTRGLDSAMDVYKGVKAEAEAAKKKEE